jgi:ABC-type multidrug transport system ATPase subunit
MKIRLENTGRRFNREWIFRKITTEFNSSESIAVLGSNGSGKSTLLQLLSGFLQPSEGTIIFENENKIVPIEDVYKHISFCSPFLELYDELTAEECFRFHSDLKPMDLQNGWKEFSEILQLKNTEGKQLRFYSSGMRQRVKLALSVLTKSEILFLDEPCTNLDIHAIAWYKELLEKYKGHRLLFVSSNNQAEETFLCTKQFNISDYKHASAGKSLS